MQFLVLDALVSAQDGGRRKKSRRAFSGRETRFGRRSLAAATMPTLYDLADRLSALAAKSS
jgi:hypothetical protein